MSQAKNEATILTDSIGRSIEFKPLKAGEQFRLVRVLGKGSTNEVYMSMALMAASVRSINNMPVPFPVVENHIEKILNDLGDEGLEAIQKHLQPAEGETAVTEDTIMDAAKN